MLRGKLNRLARRTKGYTKSVEILVNPLATVFVHKMNSMPLKSVNTKPYARFALFHSKVYIFVTRISAASAAGGFRIGKVCKHTQARAAVPIYTYL